MSFELRKTSEGNRLAHCTRNPKSQHVVPSVLERSSGQMLGETAGSTLYCETMQYDSRRKYRTSRIEGFPSAKVSRTSCWLQMLNEDPHRDHPKALTLQSSAVRSRGLCAEGSTTPILSVLEATGLGGGGGQQSRHLGIVLIFKNGLKWSVAFGTEGFSVCFTLL